MNAGSEAVRSNGPPQFPRKVGRKRRVAGCSLAMAGVIVAALWVASGWWRVEVWIGRFEAFTDSGLLFLAENSPGTRPPSRPFISRVEVGGWNWRIPEGLRLTDLREFMPKMKGLDLMIADCSVFEDTRTLRTALWPIPLLLWTPAALLLRSGILARRRASQGMCANCGYSLAGLGLAAKCPECGKVPLSVDL